MGNFQQCMLKAAKIKPLKLFLHSQHFSDATQYNICVWCSFVRVFKKKEIC